LAHVVYTVTLFGTAKVTLQLPLATVLYFNSCYCAGIINKWNELPLHITYCP